MTVWLIIDSLQSSGRQGSIKQRFVLHPQTEPVRLWRLLMFLLPPGVTGRACVWSVRNKCWTQVHRWQPLREGTLGFKKWSGVSTGNNRCSPKSKNKSQSIEFYLSSIISCRSNIEQEWSFISLKILLSHILSENFVELCFRPHPPIPQCPGQTRTYHTCCSSPLVYIGLWGCVPG